MSNPRVRALRSFGPITIPAGHYFMMGTNRDNSRDSRMFGLVPRHAIVGKAVGILGSFDIKDKCQPRSSRFFSELDYAFPICAVLPRLTCMTAGIGLTLSIICNPSLTHLPAFALAKPH